MTLQLPRRTASVSPQSRWALTSPSHPYLGTGPGRLFSSALLCPRGQLSVRKWDALRCPDFPHTSQGCKRQTGPLHSSRAAKIQQFFCSFRKCVKKYRNHQSNEMFSCLFSLDWTISDVILDAWCTRDWTLRCIFAAAICITDKLILTVSRRGEPCVCRYKGIAKARVTDERGRRVKVKCEGEDQIRFATKPQGHF